MAVRDQQFQVAEIMQVPSGAALRDFPEFPRAGSLVVLAPPAVPETGELNGLCAQVAIGPKVITLRYAYWQVNARNDIGLLCDNVDEATIPLGSRVTFVTRGRS